MTANRPRPGMSGNTLFGMMGAIVGAAADDRQKRLSLDTGTPVYTHQHSGKLCAESHDPDAVARASFAALDVHAALNTYEVASGVPEQIAHPGPETISVIGANRRRLIVRRDADGLWVGGCLITDREVAEGLAAFIWTGQRWDGDEPMGPTTAGVVDDA